MTDEQQSLITLLYSENINSRNNNESINIQKQNAELEAMRSNSQASYYRDLLTKSMKEIAEDNADFRKTYNMQQDVLSSWMVNQEAFRSLAAKYSRKLNISDEQWKEDVRVAQEEAIITVKKNEKGKFNL